MSLQRRLDWSSAVRDLTARRFASPFITAAGRYNLKAIMYAAVSEARRIGRGFGLSWAKRMSLALRLIWDKAHRAAGIVTRPLAA
jgi:hypothetical protein